MANFIGIKAQPDFFDYSFPDSLSANILNGRDKANITSIFDTVVSFGVGNRLYVEESKNQAARAGDRAVSYFNDLYNRVHLSPRSLALGNLLSSQVREFEVWNAHFTPVTYAALAESNTDGIELNEPIAQGDTVGGLASITFTISIAKDGAAVIDAAYAFYFDDEQLLLSITGKRVVVFPFKPNWKGGVRESLAWKTSILESYNGTRQRAGLRTKPRVGFDYKSLLHGDQLRFCESLLWGWSGRLFAVPVWMDKQKLESAHASGSESISILTESYGFSEGGLAIILTDYLNYETVEISSVGANAISLDRPLLNNWPSGALVFPLYLARLPSSIPSRRKTGDVAELQFSWQCDPISTTPNITTSSHPAYLGVELLTKQPNWSKDLTHAINSLVQLVDYGAAISANEHGNNPRIVRRYAWLIKGRAEISAFKSFLGRRMGRLKPVYVPTFHHDCVVVVGVGAAATGITIRDNGYHVYVNTHPARKHIEIVTTKGTFRREITGSANNGDGTITLLIDTSLDTELSVENIKRVSYMGLYWLHADTVSALWHTGDTMTVEVNLELDKP